MDPQAPSPAAPTGAPDVPVPDVRLLDLMRDDLADYTVDGVRELLGAVAHDALAREQPWPARWVVADAVAKGEPLAPVVQALLLGRPVARRRLDAALPRLGVDGAARLGLVRTAGNDPDDEVCPLVDLRPYAAVDGLGTAHWWVASDLSGQAVLGPLRSDYVLGVGGASMTLARCAFRRPARRVLDVGTGGGVQSLHASRHAGSITATDLSRRALGFARFTLALNRVPADLRRGDLLEPVIGETFDQVVSNPPFVITPRRAGVPAYAYRDAGLVGDAVVERLVTEVGRVLAPGGTVQLLGNWEHRRGEPWQARVGGWLDRAGLDGWVIQRDVQDPAQYAELWIRDGGQPDTTAYAAQYRAWWEDFAARGVEAVGLGLIVLRRPDDGEAPIVRRLEEALGGGQNPGLGDHLADCLDAQAWLDRASDDDLLAASLVAAPDVTDERYHRPGEEDPEVVLLRQGGGFGRTVQASTALAAFVGACDGELSAGRIAAALAVLAERELADVVTDLLPAVRALIADGFLRRGS
ncbi:MAG TPA: methyltransferase [Kineosporiaceae bacterium]